MAGIIFLIQILSKYHSPRVYGNLRCSPWKSRKKFRFRKEYFRRIARQIRRKEEEEEEGNIWEFGKERKTCSSVQEETKVATSIRRRMNTFGWKKVENVALLLARNAGEGEQQASLHHASRCEFHGISYLYIPLLLSSNTFLIRSKRTIIPYLCEYTKD